MATKEKPVQIFFTGRMPLAMVVEKCNRWNRKGTHRYKTIEFCRYDDFRVATTVKMKRDGYTIGIDDIGLIS